MGDDHDDGGSDGERDYILRLFRQIMKDRKAAPSPSRYDWSHFPPNVVCLADPVDVTEFPEQALRSICTELNNLPGTYYTAFRYTQNVIEDAHDAAQSCIETVNRQNALLHTLWASLPPQYRKGISDACGFKEDVCPVCQFLKSVQIFLVIALYDRADFGAPPPFQFLDNPKIKAADLVSKYPLLWEQLLTVHADYPLLFNPAQPTGNEFCQLFYPAQKLIRLLRSPIEEIMKHVPPLEEDGGRRGFRVCGQKKKAGNIPLHAEMPQDSLSWDDYPPGLSCAGIKPYTPDYLEQHLTAIRGVLDDLAGNLCNAVHAEQVFQRNPSDDPDADSTCVESHISAWYKATDKLHALFGGLPADRLSAFLGKSKSLIGECPACCLVCAIREFFIRWKNHASFLGEIILNEVSAEEARAKYGSKADDPEFLQALLPGEFWHVRFWQTFLKIHEIERKDFDPTTEDGKFLCDLFFLMQTLVSSLHDPAAWGLVTSKDASAAWCSNTVNQANHDINAIRNEIRRKLAIGDSKVEIRQQLSAHWDFNVRGIAQQFDALFAEESAMLVHKDSLDVQPQSANKMQPSKIPDTGNPIPHDPDFWMNYTPGSLRDIASATGISKSSLHETWRQETYADGKPVYLERNGKGYWHSKWLAQFTKNR